LLYLFLPELNSLPTETMSLPSRKIYLLLRIEHNMLPGLPLPVINWQYVDGNQATYRQDVPGDYWEDSKLLTASDGPSFNIGLRIPAKMPPIYDLRVPTAREEQTADSVITDATIEVLAQAKTSLPQGYFVMSWAGPKVECELAHVEHPQKGQRLHVWYNVVSLEVPI
jgi:hypothetical protein